MDIAFADALAAPGPKILAWRTIPKNGMRLLSVFSLAGGGAVQVSWHDYPEQEMEAVTAEHRAAGRSVGEYDDNSDYIWLVDDGVTVWDSKQLVLRAEGDLLKVEHGREFRRGEVRLFIAFASDDYLDRGVMAQLVDGSEVEVYVERSWTAMADPTYSRNELLFDAAWATDVGSSLALWAGAKYEDRI